MSWSDRAATSGRPPLRALTGIRAVAAGWVVLHHFREPVYALLPALRPTERWFQSGYLGVEVFFVLSGFIISYNYAEDLKNLAGRSYRSYLVARFARVYPAHLATLLLTGVLVVGAAAAGLTLNSSANYTTANFLGNLSLLQAFPGVVQWNPPSWSISCEVVAYVAFPLLAAVVARLTRRRAIVWAGVVTGVEIAAMWAIGRVFDFAPLSLPVVWVRLACEFTLGCLLWAVWRAGTAGGRRWDALAAGSVVATGLVLTVVDPFGPGAFLTLPFLALFVFACACATGPVHRVLSTPLMCRLGRISYSVYLTHFLVMVVVVKLAAAAGLAGEPLAVRLLVVVLYGVAVVLAGAALHHVVEEPCRKLVRRFGAGRRERTAIGAVD